MIRCSGRAIWGLFFLVVGGLLLLQNLGLASFAWGAVWKLWPVVLILMGVSALVGGTGARWVALAIGAAMLALIVVAGFQPATWFSPKSAVDQTYDQPMLPSITAASFSLESGAGSFTIRDTTDRLYDAQISSSFGPYESVYRLEGARATIKLRQGHTTATFPFLGRTRNDATIRLNRAPTWDIIVDAGAAALNLDLRPFIVANLTVDSGASSIGVQLGDRSDSARVKIGAGASSISVSLPSAVGSELKVDGGLTSKTFDGFEKVDGRTYRTPGFEDSAKKIYLEIDAGVSSINVRRT